MPTVLSRILLAVLVSACAAGTGRADARNDADLAAAADSARANAWAAAESLAVAVLDRATGASPPDPAAMDRALAALAGGRLQRRQVDDEQGVVWAARLLELRRAASPPDTAAIADAEVLLGQILGLAERVPDAVAHLEQGVALRRTVRADTDSLVADALWRLGGIHRRATHAAEARRALDEALARYRPRGADDALAARIRVELAGALALLQEHDESRRHYEAALPAFRALYGDGAELGAIYDGLSQLEKFAGNLAASLEWLERSVDVKMRGLGADAPGTLISRANLGGRLIEFGDPSAARRWLEPTVPGLESRYGAGHAVTEQARTNLGVACLAGGDEAAARTHLESSLAALRAHPGHHEAAIAWTLRWLARVACVEGDLEAARKLHEEALDLARPFEEGDPAMLLELHTERLAVLGALGDRDAIPAAIDSTAAVLARRGLERSQFAVLTRAEQARAFARIGRTREAWDTALASDAAAHRLVLANVSRLSDRNALALSGEWSDALPVLVRLALGGAPADPATAWDRAQRWRGWWGDALELHRAPRTSDPDVLRAHDDWVAAEREYGRAIVDQARGDGGDDATLEAARTKAERAEATYRKRAARHGIAPGATAPGLAGITARLGRGDALVAFAVATLGPDDPETIAAFAVRGGGEVAIVDLGAAGDVRARLDRWRMLLSTPPGASAAGAAEAEAACRRAGEAVRAARWDPLAPWTDGADAVYVVDAVLGDVPWLALPLGDSAYLAEAGPRLRVLGAERDLLRAEPSRRDDILLAVGNPDFDRAPRDGAAVTLRGAVSPCTPFPRLGPLPSAGLEAREVAKLVSRNARVRIGSDADEARFKREAPGCTVLHLATHGVVLADTCATASAPGRRAVGGIAPVASTPAPARSRWAQVGGLEGAGSPWLGRRVWLALAGANHAQAARGEDDGMLTAEEVVTLDLRSVDWAVLSACHSGSLESWSREGALGMTRALHLAGARTVIASRWELEDDSAREWMRALYRARGRGARSGGAALQDACRAVLAARRADGRTTHPFAWASFTASGD